MVSLLIVIWIEYQTLEWNLDEQINEKRILFVLMSIYRYQMSLGAILEFYNSATMNLTHNIRKNKVNIDLSLLF